MPVPDRRLSIAPMMDWTDRHCRYFLRLLIAARALLYTEMVTTGAVLHGDARACSASIRPSIRSPSSWRRRPGELAARARFGEASATTRSTSTSAAPRIGCRAAASAPA